jgi:hypothetical protein
MLKYVIKVSVDINIKTSKEQCYKRTIKKYDQADYNSIIHEMEGKNWSILFGKWSLQKFGETLISSIRFGLFIINKSTPVADVWIIRVGSHTPFSKLRRVRMSSRCPH